MDARKLMVFWFSNWQTGKTTAKYTNHIEWQKSLCIVCICTLRASCKMTTAHCMVSVFQTLLTKLLLYAAFFCANFSQCRLYQSRQGDEKFASDSRHASSTSNFVSVDADGNETLKSVICSVSYPAFFILPFPLYATDIKMVGNRV